MVSSSSLSNVCSTSWFSEHVCKHHCMYKTCTVSGSVLHLFAQKCKIKGRQKPWDLSHLCMTTWNRMNEICLAASVLVCLWSCRPELHRLRQLGCSIELQSWKLAVHKPGTLYLHANSVDLCPPFIHIQCIECIWPRVDSEHCRICPSCFLAECRKRQLMRGVFCFPVFCIVCFSSRRLCLFCVILCIFSLNISLCCCCSDWMVKINKTVSWSVYDIIADAAW